ncbi:MAG: hypothetical protein V3T83_09375 [Acidobacteriota bacterium]
MKFARILKGAKHPWPLRSCLIIALAVPGLSPWASGQPSQQSTTSSGEAQPHDGPADWPRQLESGKTHFTIYQPQLDFWDGHSLRARAAVAVKGESDKDPTYGSIWIKGRTSVDKDSRMVSVDQLSVTKTNFPTKAAEAAGYQKALNDNLHGLVETMALDRLQAQLEIMHAVEAADALPLRNEPPEIIFSTVPAILVTIDGPPVFKPVPKVKKIERAINTRVLLLKDRKGRVYLHVFDGWMKASGLDGEWTVDKRPSKKLRKAEVEALKGGSVDLLQGGSAEAGDRSAGSQPGGGGEKAEQQPPPSLTRGPVPKIHVATKAAELIVSDGKPDYVPIEGTDLLYVKNTSADIFEETKINKPTSGSPGVGSVQLQWTGPGPVEGKDLPHDFANIPDDSDKENVKVSVPGTAQAQEALISNSIPQTAAVKIDQAKFSPPRYDGDPKLEPIKGTELHYAVNASGTGDRGVRDRLLFRRERCLVHLRVARRPLAGGQVGTHRDLHHPAEFTPALRDLRLCL